MKNDLIVTLVQVNQIWEDKEANFKNYERLLESTEQSDVILLPEMFNTGFSMNASELAESYSESKSIEWLKSISSSKNTAIFTSLIIEEENHYFNRGVFIEPNGSVSIYDKRKTFGLAGEDLVFSRGEKSTIVNYKGWNIRLQICYDLRFPEISLNQHENGFPEYDLLLYVANWPERRSTHWRTLLPARAIENQCYVAGVNRVGADNTGLTYSGDSCVVDLLGNRIVDVVNEEEVVSVVLSGSELNELREKLPFLKDRTAD